MKLTLRIWLSLGLQAMLVGCSALPSQTPLSSSVTSAPASPPASTPSPVVTPTETPVPIARVSTGDEALFNGDIDSAIQEYQAAAADTSDPNIRAAALWGLARAQYDDARYDSSITTLEQLLSEFPDSPYAAPAKFMEGQDLVATQHFNEAASAYQVYLTSRPGVLDSYVEQLRGDALAKAGDYTAALAAYTAAAAAPHLDDAQALQIKIAQMNDQAGNTETAISMYDSIATNTTNDYIRARMDYLSGKAYLSLQKTETAYERFKHAVENYPLSSYSYLALVELVSANVSVNDLDRGLTDFFAGVPDKALEVINRYIAENPNNDGTAYYYRALCLDDLQKYQEAVDALSYFIDHYSSHAKWADAWDRKSAIQWVNLNSYPAAAQTMLDFVKAAPGSDHAPEALMTAARILERDGRFDQAAEIWRRVGDEYATNPQASTALMFAGLMQYRQADYRAALPLYERSLVLATLPEDQARAYLWIGKTQDKLRSPNDAQNAWQLAQSADPAGYYGERASDLLMGRMPFASASVTNLDFDLAAERRAADSWMRLTFDLPPATDLTGLDTLATDSRLIRGRELWNLGLLDDARLEFEDLRLAVSADPVLTYRLANYLLDLGLYRSGISAARQVLTLAGLKDQASSMLAPTYFTHVRYGLYYRDLIIPAAQTNGMDPLFLFSVVRQESLFEGFVSSTAGARGLMQIVPSTGAGISGMLRWPVNFEPDQLYRPNVSITLGSYYLASNRTSFGGDLYGALAAYNGGPGSTLTWKALAPDDPDLFLESIRAQETRDYIRSIYEIYVIYRRLYGPGS
jgi:soluble lytic murein transglycosylase